MKRSEINAALKEMEQMVQKYRFALPPFCNFTPEEWGKKGHDYDEIRDNMLGWDITDYGLGDFDKVGFSLITIRNGNLNMKDKYTKTYAEKLLYIKEGQYSPMHFHWSKMEDIINRGGGNVLIRVYNSTKEEDLDKVHDVHVHVDGREMVVPAGNQVRLTPGESITEAVRSFWEKSASATMTTQITAFTRRWEDSQRLKRMKSRIACFVLSIRQQNNRRSRFQRKYGGMIPCTM